MKKKLLAGMLCVSMVAAMLTGCGSGDDGKTTGTEGSTQVSGEEGKEEGKTIELWTCWSPGEETETKNLEQIKKWEEATGNKVNQTNFTYDMLHEKILTAAAGGNVPDLVWGLPEYIGEFYNMGMISDLTSYYETWEDKSALSEAVINAMTIDSKIIGVPYEMTVRAYLVHENDFGETKIPTTWEELLALSSFKTDTGKYATTLACTGVRSPQELLVYLAQNDVQICSAQEDGKYKNTWKENPAELEKAAKVFQFYKDMIYKGIVDANAKNWGWEETDENFATGIVASYVSGNWLAEREKSNTDIMADVKILPIPYPADGKAATYMECKPLFIMEGSEKKDEAFSLATAFCGKEWQTAAFLNRSPRSDVSADTKWSKDFTALADTGITFPPVTLSGITQAMQDSIAKVLQEGKTPTEAAEWLSDAVNAALSETGELSQ